MKKVWRTWMGLLLLVMAVASGIAVCPEAKAEEMKASKKIISVVYDDSGTMYSTAKKSTKWAQANYALQAFAALLDEQDEMYITYMSKAPVPEKNSEEAKQDYVISASDVDALDMSDIPGSVEQIRNNVGGAADTPVQSIDAAMDKLMSVNDTDENTQYWLVILTDGKMFASKQDETDGKAADVQGKLDSLKGTQMPNGSSVYITYLGISNANGSGAESLNPDSANGFDAVTTSDIVTPLSDIANKVSGRMTFEDGDITAGSDGKTYTLHTDIPLYSIAVFSQRSNAEVAKIEGISDDGVRNIALKYPEVPAGSKYTTDESLYGNAALAANSDGTLIQPGDYTVTFSENVSEEDIVFMYQAAVTMVPKITKNDAKLDAEDLENSLVEGDKIDIELVPTNPETGEVIADSDLPEGITWGISYSIDGTETASAEDRILKNVEVGVGENQITCTMKIPNMTPQSDTCSFTVTAPVVYDLTIGDGGGDAWYYRSAMGKKGCQGTPISFVVTGDGVPLTKEEAKDLDISISDVTLDDSQVTGNFFETWGIHEAKTVLKLQEDGSYMAYPKAAVIPFLVKTGAYTVTVHLVLEDGTAYDLTGTYTVKGRWIDWLYIFILAGILVILLYVVIGLFILKPKFHRQKLKIQVYEGNGGNQGIHDALQDRSKRLSPFANDNPLAILTPAASNCSLAGIKVYAGKGGTVCIRKADLARHALVGSGSGLNPERKFMTIVRSMEPGSKATGDKVLGVNPYYIYNPELNQLYEITVSGK